MLPSVVAEAKLKCKYDEKLAAARKMENARRRLNLQFGATLERHSPTDNKEPETIRREAETCMNKRGFSRIQQELSNTQSGKP